ncbi:hypothetical protein SAMN05421819_0718 [Bryocella elongata]|uniref:JmjC domain-containing protein n=1 Tax=Bryocella elongata TaxID=863522 RepID=A0A1H5TRW2_9BACT|nr:transcriptional regulator [Bryocella elongata]SEF65622.1 hypothetical protein SAMN05421819_0718 [Bryocella elongata]
MPYSIGRVIECERGVFERDLNLRPFEVAHTLRDHPLLQLSALIELADAMASSAPSDVDYNQGVIETRENRSHRPPPTRDYAARLLHFINQADASVTLRHIERQDGYRQIMEALVLDALSLAGAGTNDLLRRIESFEAILLVTSPNRVTEYHVDSDCSWIFQVGGAKSIHLFDREDTSILPQEELERFYAVDRRAPRYKPQYESRANITTIAPGSGLHIPANTPHWLLNGPEVSISLNIVFHLRDAVHASLYRANHFLRKVGVTPSIPGQFPARDRAKAIASSLMMKLGRRLSSSNVPVPREAVMERRRIAALVAAR